MKNKNNNIVILTGLVRSGKTTLLMEWMDSHPKSRGVLTPDIDGIRFFFHYPEKQLIKMQVFDDKKEVIRVGRFLFSKDNFDQVNRLLMTDVKAGGLGWVVIDEVGILELKEEGLFPAFQYALQSNHPHILIVVRDKLLNRVIEQFGLEDAHVIYKEDLTDI